jgi:hypothetical protein
VATAKQSETSSQVLGGLLILAHHPVLGKHGVSLWTNLLQQAGISPPEFVEAQYTSLKSLIWTTFAQPVSAYILWKVLRWLAFQSAELKQAAFSSLATLALVSPTLIVVDVVSEISNLLQAAKIDKFTSTEFAIFNHPADSESPYVDVLAAAKPKQEVGKGKHQAIEKWENDIRKSLQSKTPAANKTLSRAEKALVQEQLAREADIRASMQAAFDQIRIGLSLASTLLSSGLDITTSDAIPTMISALVPLFRSPYASVLQKSLSQTWSALAAFCLSDLHDIAAATASATLYAVRSSILLDPAQDVSRMFCRLLLHRADSLRSARLPSFISRPLRCLSPAISFLHLLLSFPTAQCGFARRRRWTCEGRSR